MLRVVGRDWEQCVTLLQNTLHYYYQVQERCLVSKLLQVTHFPKTYHIFLVKSL